MAFDELHALKIKYSEWFGDMEISETEKKERKELAEEIELLFMALFLMAADKQDKQLCLDYARSQYKQLCNKFLGANKTSAYINQYVNMITENILDVTLDNIKSDYYTSQDRAIFIAANEANTIGNYREQVQKIKNGYKFKTWMTQGDDKVRPTHILVDNTKISVFEPFNVGGSKLMFPRDYSLGADSNEIINCRCVAIYSKT